MNGKKQTILVQPDRSYKITAEYEMPIVYKNVAYLGFILRFFDFFKKTYGR